MHRRKPGPQSKLDDEDKLFTTLVRLKQGCTEEDLAWRFQISISACSCIPTPWIPFLSKELDDLIYLCTEKDLAWRFQISVIACSCILTTWIQFLSKELDDLIY